MSSISKKRKREFIERGKTFMGRGRSRDFQALPGQILTEEGRRVFSVPSDYFCDQCECAGCKRCKWTGVAPKYLVERAVLETINS